MEKTSALSGYKTVCLIVLVFIACCAVSSLFVSLYTNTLLMERIGKLEGKLEVLDNTKIWNHEVNQLNRSIMHHRDKRSTSAETLAGVSKRLKTLENR